MAPFTHDSVTKQHDLSFGAGIKLVSCMRQVYLVLILMNLRPLLFVGNGFIPRMGPRYDVSYYIDPRPEQSKQHITAIIDHSVSLTFHV